MNFLSDLLTTEKDRQDFFISLFVIVFFGGILYVFFPASGIQIDKIPHASTNLAPVEAASDIPNQLAAEETWEEDAYRYPDEETYIEEAIIPATAMADSMAENVSEDRTAENLDQTPESDENEDLIESVIDSLEEEKILDTTATQTTEASAIEAEEEATLLEEEKEILEEIASTEESKVDEVNNAKPPVLADKPTSKKLMEEVEENKEDANLGQSFDCAIIIGAFLDKGNVESLKKRLKKDGYNLYLSWRKGYRVIGVETPCEKSVAKKTLTEIRKKYAKDAWLLKKK